MIQVFQAPDEPLERFVYTLDWMQMFHTQMVSADLSRYLFFNWYVMPSPDAINPAGFTSSRAGAYRLMQRRVMLKLHAALDNFSSRGMQDMARRICDAAPASSAAPSEADNLVFITLQMIKQTRWQHITVICMSQLRQQLTDALTEGWKYFDPYLRKVEYIAQT